MNNKCELCKFPARMYCESDQASLCWDCDAKVHGANFLVARHTRTLLCDTCQSPTAWKASSAKLGHTVSVCENCVQGRRDDSDGEDEQTDTADVDESYVDDEDEEEEGDNQVVPWSSEISPPPAVSYSSSSEEESSSRSRLPDGSEGDHVYEVYSLKRNRENGYDLLSRSPRVAMAAGGESTRVNGSSVNPQMMTESGGSDTTVRSDPIKRFRQQEASTSNSSFGEW